MIFYVDGSQSPTTPKQSKEILNMFWNYGTTMGLPAFGNTVSSVLGQNQLTSQRIGYSQSLNMEKTDEPIVEIC